MTAPAFRHDPRKCVLTSGPVDRAVCWDREPAVCAYRRFSHTSARLGRDVPVPICSSPVVLTGIGVVVATFDGRVRLFSRTLDKVFWERRLPSPVYASLVADRKRRTILVAAVNGLVGCLDLRGNAVWKARTEVPLYATPTVIPDSDVLVLAGFGSRCIGLDLATGDERFDRELPKPWHAAVGGSAAHRDPYASPAVTADGNVVVCCAEHALCLAPDGTMLWRQEIGHAVRASPVALHDTGEVAVCGVDGRCRFLDAGTGAEKATLDLSAKIVASPAVSGAVLAVGTTDDRVSGVDIHNHKVAWTAHTGSPRDHTSFTVLPSGDLVSTAANGNALGRRTRDGQFRWETSQLLGLPEHDPAMDITPVAGPDGSMYCGSYSGVLYYFRFPQVPGED